MKISVAEILPGDKLVLPDGSTREAAGAWSPGPLQDVEVEWVDGSAKGIYPRETMLAVLGRLHMAVPSEQEIAQHRAWTTMRPGKDQRMTDELQALGAYDDLEKANGRQ